MRYLSGLGRSGGSSLEGETRPRRRRYDWSSRREPMARRVVRTALSRRGAARIACSGLRAPLWACPPGKQWPAAVGSSCGTELSAVSMLRMRGPATATRSRSADLSVSKRRGSPTRESCSSGAGCERLDCSRAHMLGGCGLRLLWSAHGEGSGRCGPASSASIHKATRRREAGIGRGPCWEAVFCLLRWCQAVDACTMLKALLA